MRVGLVIKGKRELLYSTSRNSEDGTWLSELTLAEVLLTELEFSKLSVGGAAGRELATIAPPRADDCEAHRWVLVGEWPLDLGDRGR
jgi:hypothetical protein